MARKSQFRIDLHVHSKYSGESQAEPKEIIECALEKGLDGICITEHESLYVSRPFEEIKNEYPLLIFRGVELATDAGHILVYGIDDEVWDDWGKDRICNAQELIDRASNLGGIAVPAHPWHISRGAGDQDGLIVSIDDRITNLRNLTAIEVCNGKQAGNPIVHEVLGTFARENSLGALGGSDAHTPENVGRAFTLFRVPIHSPKQLINALLSKQYYPQIG